MPLLNVSNVDVEFPFEPYPCQVAYMEKVIECLKRKHNGILESPTGTGKTLNLLCASLAWLQYDRDSKMGAAFGAGRSLAETPMTSDSFDIFGQKCQIIYTSRTHAQLMQAMREFRRTSYAARFKAIALGARDHLCLNTSVLKETNSAVRVHMCRAKVSAKVCYFHNNLDKTEVVARQEMCLDIEDLVKLGTKHSFCPYFMSKKLTPDYDIIFMPYNYVLTKSMRKANNIDLKNSVVIFDEAHNVHRCCEDASSVELTSTEIALAIDELTQVGKLLSTADKPTDGSEEVDDSAIWSPPTKGKSAGGSKKEDVPEITFQEAMEVKKVMLDLEEAVDHIPLEERNKFGSGDKTKQKSYEGHEIYNIFREAGITFSTSTRYIALITSAVDFLNKDATSQNQSALFRSKGSALSHIVDCLNVIFVTDFDANVPLDRDTEQRLERENSKEFKMHVAEIDNGKRANKDHKPGEINWERETQNKSESKGRCLSYWCLSASHAMRDLPSLGVRSVLLTSGTLSPLRSLAAELGLPFEVVFQNKHVISSKQCHVAIVEKGPDNTELKSTYQCRDSPDYMNSLGMLLVNMARRVTGGTLVFFPSYTLLDSCVSTWQRQSKPGVTPVFNTLNDIRRVIVEPRGKTQFSRTYEEYDTTIKERGGAVLMAVCRGKASEGIDFSDYQSRLVVIIGLPYPPIFDPRVVLKMAYLDDLNRKGVRLPTGEKMALAGREWYEQEAMRAVNQAIGRVIRHRWDYGFVVLADSRFAIPGVRNQLPMWLQSSLVPYAEKVGKLLTDMSEFYRLAMLEFDHDPLAQRLLELTKTNSSLSSASSHNQSESLSQVRVGVLSQTVKSQTPIRPGSFNFTPASVLPCSQKPSPSTSASALKEIYGSQALSSSSKQRTDHDESVFSRLENVGKPQTPVIATVVKTLPALAEKDEYSSQISSQRKRKFAVLSPPSVQPLQPKQANNVSGASNNDKEARIRQIAALMPPEKREKLFRPFLTYRKAVSLQSDQNALQILMKELSAPTFSLMLKSCPKELLVLSDVIHPTHQETYMNFLLKNNIKS